MFVQVPPLDHNGWLLTNKPGEVNAYDQGGFTSAGAAAAYERHELNYRGYSLYEYNDRQNMQSGRVAEGRFRPTSYRRLALRADYSKAFSKVVTINPADGKFSVRYRDAALGYIGGFSTGWGNPWEIYLPAWHGGHWSSIANKVICDNLDLRARTEIMLRARNQKFDVSEALAGIDKTVLMVANKVRQVVSAWKSVRQGNLALAMRHLGLNPLGIRSEFYKKFKYHIKNASVAEQWLALVYGWLPLLSDIADGVNLVNTGLTRPDSVFVVKRNISAKLPFTQWMLNEGDDPWKNPEVRHDVTATYSYKYRLKVKDQLAAYLLTLGLDNPVYSFWVAVPYSFVIDWLSPVGDWLQALSAPMALQFVDGYRSHHIEGWESRTAGPYGVNENDPNIRYYSGPAEVHFEFIEFEREQLTEFPVVQPYVRYPFTSPNRLVNAAALIQTAKQHKGRV